MTIQERREFLVRHGWIAWFNRTWKHPRHGVYGFAEAVKLQLSLSIEASQVSSGHPPRLW
jgi:hypothetical protein